MASSVASAAFVAFVASLALRTLRALRWVETPLKCHWQHDTAATDTGVTHDRLTSSLITVLSVARSSMILIFTNKPRPRSCVTSRHLQRLFYCFILSAFLCCIRWTEEGGSCGACLCVCLFVGRLQITEKVTSGSRWKCAKDLVATQGETRLDFGSDAKSSVA